jgi:uncharacterized protein
MNVKSVLFALIAMSGAMGSPAVAAAPVTDCAKRDAPFSIESPFIDVLLSPAARAILDKAAPGRFSRLPAQFAGTTPPTFAAILSLREASQLVGLSPDVLAAIEPELRALTVTKADKVARCARYDNETPRFDLPKGKMRILLFQKVNGFYHADAIPAAQDAFVAMAARKGWAIAATDKGGAINASTLRQFDVVIWNNNSGDVLTLSQRSALKRYIERGGGFVAIHGAGGDPAYFWDWYADSLLGARFKGHPAAPQFQDARVVVEAPDHPIANALPQDWTMNDEWYSFHNGPSAAAGATVILSLDEATYKPEGMMNQDLRMGEHPLAWVNCVGKGRAFYSAIGHRAESYHQPQHLALLESAISWTADKSLPCEQAEAATTKGANNSTAKQ